MHILTNDRISGLAASNSPLSTYGPGNMLDDSNRNSWVSGDTSDTLTINCNSQVNGLFLGRYQADDLRLTYLGREIRGNITSTGAFTVGYTLSILGVTYAAISGGYEVTLTVDSTAKVNINDVIEVTGFSSANGDSNRNQAVSSRTSPGNSHACGFHKVTKVQTERILSSVNLVTTETNTSAEVNSLTTVSYTVISNPGPIVWTLADMTPTIGEGNLQAAWEAGGSYTNVVQGETSGSGSGARFSITTDGSGIPTITTISDYGSGYASGDTLSIEDPGNTTNTITLTIVFSGTVKNGIKELEYEYTSVTVSLVDAEKSIYEYIITIGDPGLFASTTSSSTSANPFVVGQSFTLSGLNSNLGSGYLNGTHVITGTNSSDKTFKFRSYHASAPTITAGNFKISLSTSIFFDGGTLLHYLGEITGANKNINFTNTDAIRVKGCSTTAVNINGIGGSGPLTYTDALENTITEGSLLKNFSKSSVKDQYKFSTLLSAYVESASNSGTTLTDGDVQKYVTDTSDTLVTQEGSGAQIHRARLTTRTQTSLANFVTGDLVLVKSTYIPLPREAHPSELQLDYESTLNRNAGNLFNEWILESVTTEGSTVTINGFSYNVSDNGKLLLKLSSSSHGFAVNDYIEVTLPTSRIYNTNFTVGGFTTSGSSTTITTTNTLNHVYVGMGVTGSGIPSETTVSSLTSSTQCVISNATTLGSPTVLTFAHTADAKTDADIAFNRIHRIIAVAGDDITLYAPNYGVSADLTKETEITFNTSSGTDTQALVHSSPLSERYIQKIKGGRGRFVRPVKGSTTIEQRLITHLLWNSGTSAVTYTVSTTDYEVAAGTATAIFASAHGLVNNDKILLYGLSSHTEGQKVVSLEDSYLVTYGTSTTVTFNITSANQKTGTSQTAANGSTTMTVVTSTDHGFAVNDVINLYNASTTTYNGTYEVKSAPTSKSFTITLATAVGSTISLTGQSALVTSGVHFRSAGTYRTSGDTSSATDALTNISCCRTVSVDDADSTFERPISVGNILYIDGYEDGSSIYATDENKTPVLDDKNSNTNYDSSSTTAVQGTFIGQKYSPKGQISKVVGDGTSKNNIELMQAIGKIGHPLEFTSLFHAVLTGILRAGVSQTFPNPQQGLSNSFKDYSVRKELATGSYYYLNRESAKQFSGSLVGSPEEIDKLIDFGQDQLAEPFAVLIVSGTGTEIKKLRIRAAVYGYFTALPTASFKNKLATLKSTSFNIKEVL